jgi:hypothetical protein
MDMSDETNITLGQMVGQVDVALGVKNDAGDKVKINVTIDFSTASDQDVRQWLGSNRVIAGQRPWRSLSKDELEGLNGKVFMAQDIGKKVKSRAEQINALIGAGLPKNLAEFAIDNPVEFAQVTCELESGLGGDDE